jgi:hypothetical protein
VSCFRDPIWDRRNSAGAHFKGLSHRNLASALDQAGIENSVEAGLSDPFPCMANRGRGAPSAQLLYTAISRARKLCVVNDQPQQGEALAALHVDDTRIIRLARCSWNRVPQVNKTQHTDAFEPRYFSAPRRSVTMPVEGLRWAGSVRSVSIPAALRSTRH